MASEELTKPYKGWSARILGDPRARGLSFLPIVSNWGFALLLLFIGGDLAFRGAKLISLGGSWYYLIAGLALVTVAALLVVRATLAPKLYAVIIGVTVFWALAEAGLQFMSLLPRLGAWIVVGTWFLSPWCASVLRRDKPKGISIGRRWIVSTSGLAIAVLGMTSLQGYDVVESARADVADSIVTEDWRHYGNSAGGTRFSELSMINRSNIEDLAEVWRFRTGIPTEFKNTPLQVGELLYACAAGNVVIALDAATGEESWRYDPVNTITNASETDTSGLKYFSRTCRGIGYKQLPSAQNAVCEKRILIGTTDARLIAIDATDGQICSDFGDGGEVDLREGLGPHKPYDYMITSPPLIAGDKVVVGGWVIDNQELGNVSGVVRAYDIVDGAFAWAWDMGNPDNQDGPDEGDHYTLGTPNVWSMMSYDEDLDLLYAPTGNASPDYYGAKRRPFDEEYSSSVVALRGSTGDVAWSYQTVHHDIWDYDVPSQPSLVDITVDGKDIPALIAPTKRGEIFALDRRTGQLIYPATTCPDGSAATAEGECPVPQGTVQGDFAAATQPFSGLPNFRPFRHEKDTWGLTPLDHLHCRIEYRKMRYNGHLTPPMRGGGGDAIGGETWGGTLQFPGNTGGFNWPSVSVDTDNGWVVAQVLVTGNRVLMVTEDEIPSNLEANRQQHLPSANPDASGFGPDVPRFTWTAPFLSEWKIPFLGTSLNTPCLELPLGRIAVIDLNTNKLLWSRSIGRINVKNPSGFRLSLPFEIGTPALGGTTTTRSGLIFQVGTFDATIRAIDIQTGEILWLEELPATTSSTPITYSVDGKQFVAIAVPDYSGDEGGSWMIAYALPENEQSD